MAAAGLLLSALGACGEPARDASPSAPQWFREITSEVGLDFTHETGATGALYMPEIMGSGCALLDYNNDGDLDVYLLNGNHTLPAGGRAQDPLKPSNVQLVTVGLPPRLDIPPPSWAVFSLKVQLVTVGLPPLLYIPPPPSNPKE